MSTRRLQWALGLGAVAMGSAAAAVAYMTQRVFHGALPQLKGDHTVHGLRRPVEIIRDRWGVPHIYAETEEDLFFAQGYVQAQDRLFQMDAQRRAGYGRLGEIAGPLALESDRMARICAWHQAARAQWRGLQLNFHYTVRRELESDAVGPEVGIGSWGGGVYGEFGIGMNTGVYTREEGVLYIDVIDSKTGDILWRGKGTHWINEHWDPKTKTRKINGLVDKILEQFPPKG
jgi:hypothetical protein